MEKNSSFLCITKEKPPDALSIPSLTQQEKEE